MKNPKVIIALIVALLLTVIALQNTESVTTEILWMSVEMPRVLLLVTTLLAGVAIGVSLSAWMRKR